MKKFLVTPLFLAASLVGFAQNDTIIKKEGNKEVKIIVSNNGNNKDVVVYKKYVVTDGEDLEEVMDKIQAEKESGKVSKEKKEIVIIQNGSNKVIQKIEINSPNIDSIEKVVEAELAKLENITIDINGVEAEIEKKVTSPKGDTTKVMLGNRVIVIAKDEKGDTQVKMKKQEDEIVKEESEDGHDEDAPKTRKRSDVDWFALDLGLNFLTSGKTYRLTNNEFKNMEDLRQWKSVNVTTHFLPTRVSLNKRGNVSLKTALSLDFNNYRFNHDNLLNPDSNSLYFNAYPEKLKKNKLVTTYAQIPLLLNFKIGRKKNAVDFSVGGYAGYLLDGKTKIVTNDKGEKIKKHDDFNLNPWKYGVTARLDFRWFDFYVNYNLSEMFKEAQAPNYQVLSAGINLIHF